MKQSTKVTRTELHTATGQWAIGPRWLPRERGLVRIETTSRSSRWPAEIGDRRWSRARADDLPRPPDSGHRGECNGTSAAPIWSPEQASTVRPSGRARRWLVRWNYGMQSSRLGMLWDSGAHQEHAGLDGDVNGGRHRRNSWRRPPGRWCRRRRFRTRRLNSLWGLTLSRTVIMLVCSAWLGEASIAGGNGDWRSHGSGMGRIETRRKQTETRVRRRAFIGRWSTPRHNVEQGEDASERRSSSRCRAVVHALGEDEDELLSDILDEGVSGWLSGLLLVGGLGCSGGLVLGCRGLPR